VVEEQEACREVHEYILPRYANIEILRVSGIGEKGSILQAITGLSPNVLLISVKKLNKDLIEELTIIKNSHPAMGIVVLIICYSSKDVELMRRLALYCESGLGLFLKQSLDKSGQLSRTIVGISQGQVILDPTLATLMFVSKPENPFLKQLTNRELEILNLMSQGNTNSSIAKTLFIDIKTVEHHLNRMYAKLKENPDYNTKHLRVSAARLYLETRDALYQNDESLVRETTVR
jgi:DNA-binding NarL/FixJ family response regulator